MKELDLNISQRRAAQHTCGPMMALAGPGSGKTTVITCRALHLIRRERVSPGRILIITYSKASSEEMRIRFEALTGRPEERGAVFCTFHALCYRIIRQHGGCDTEQLLREAERRAAVKKILAADGFAVEDEFLSNVLNELSLVKNELYDLKYYQSAVLGAEVFKSLYTAYEAYKREINSLDFDDMLKRCYELLTAQPGMLVQWQKRYDYIMIDEFQDINRVQYECVKMLSALHQNLFIVGDDDQSIYRFRGARPEFLLNFPKDFPGTERIVLETNYRSTDQIIGFSNHLIAENTVRYSKQSAGTAQTGDTPKIFTTDDPNQEAVFIAGRIRELQKKGRDLNGIAVIYRVNIQSRALMDAFLQSNLPYRVKDEISVIYEHWVARDIFAYMRLSRGAAAGYDPDTELIINKPYRYISKTFLLSAKKSGKNIFDVYARDLSLHDGQKNRIEELQMDLRLIGKQDPVNAVRHIRQTVGYDEYLRSYCEYRKIEPGGLYEIARELQEAAKQFKTIEEYLAHAAETITAAKQEKNNTGPHVTLTTMHSAKGLEYDTVYIAGAVEGVVPHERSKTEAELEEERRLLYVGVTRARRELFISVVRNRYDKPVKPSRFLKHFSENKK